MARNENERIAEDGELFCTHIGGAATLEGVMMRGKKSWAVAVRREDGTMYVEEHDLADPSLRPSWMRWPIVRGCVSFCESMMLSYQAMQIAADHVYIDEPVTGEGATKTGTTRVSNNTDHASAKLKDATSAATDNPNISMASDHDPNPRAQSETDAPKPAPASTAQAQSQSALSGGTATPYSASSPAPEVCEATTEHIEEVPWAQAAPGTPAPAPPVSEPAISPLEMLLSAGAGMALGLVLFVALPVSIATLLLGQITPDNSLAWNLVEAAVRICILVAYVGGIGLVPDVRRVYGYHGAEHQSIHCFEHGLPLTPENAAKFSRLHVRCGTAFLVMTVAVAIVVHSVVPVAAWADALGITGIARVLFVFATRLAMLPLVVGLSYEVTVKWAGSHPENPLVKIALWPGLQMQRLTTRTADAGMLECAIEALKRVDAREHTELSEGAV